MASENLLGGCLLSEHLQQAHLRVAGPCFHVSVYGTQAMSMISQCPALKPVVENFPRECITKQLTPWLASLRSPTFYGQLTDRC